MGRTVCSSGTDDCRVSDFVGDYVFCAAWENLSVSDWTEYDAGIYAAPDPAGYPDVCGNLRLSRRLGMVCAVCSDLSEYLRDLPAC